LFSVEPKGKPSAPSRGRVKGTRIFSPTINRLRGFALLLIVAYHAGGVLDLPNVLHGESGVDIFLMISGYLLATSAVDTPLGNFMRRRFLRIFPAYWMALVLFIALEFWFSGVHRTGPDLVLHVLGLQGFSRTKYVYGINDSFWFISIIVFCYCAFLGVRRHLGDLALLIRSASLLTAALAVYLLWFEHYVSVPLMVPRVPDFFIGLVAGRLASGRGLQFRPGMMLALSLVVLAYVSVAYGIEGYLVLWALAYLCIFLCLEAALSRGAVGKAILSAMGIVGTYSYEVYLLHQPLMRNYSRMVIERACGIVEPSRGQLVAGMCAGLLVAAAGAFVLHRLVEVMLGGRRNLRDGPGGSPPAEA
jgi:peptidoglycan/LPS O-acetylase OafA/YrhL